MTIQDIKHKLQLRKQTVDDTDRLIKFINTVEWKIKREIVDTHEGAKIYPFHGYTRDDVSNVCMIAPEPYSELYVYFVMAQISLSENNIANYNNEIALFQHYYDDFAAFYTRNHMPLAKQNLSMRGYGV